MTTALARRIALAILQPVMYRIVADTTHNVVAGIPIQVDYGYSIDEIRTAEDDRTKISGIYRSVSAKADFTTATLVAYIGWLEGLKLPTA